MNNEIKKIILSVKDKNLKGLIVLRDNLVETYGYGKISNDELLDKYSELVKELKKQSKEELKDLDGQDAVNKLYLLDKIEYNYNNLITKITNYYDEDGKLTKFITTYENGQEKVDLTDCYDEVDFYEKYKDKLVEMCKTYDIKLDSPDDLTKEFASKLKTMGLIEYKNAKKVESIEDIVVEKTKAKNFVMNHKLLSALIAAGVIGIVLSIHGCHKKNNNIVNPEDLKTDNTIEDQIEYFYEEMPTEKPLEYFTEIAFENEENIFPNYIETSDNTIIAHEYNGQGYNIYDSYYGHKDNLIDVRNKNMSNVANYIQSNIKIKDQGIYIYHENLFDNNLRDKAFVKYFSMFGNQIIKNAYQNKAYGLVIDNSIKSDEELIRLIMNNEPLEVYICGERQNIYFNELSYEAKEMVLNIAWTNNLPLNKSIVLSGFNQDDISNMILEQSEMLNMIK